MRSALAGGSTFCPLPGKVAVEGDDERSARTLAVLEQVARVLQELGAQSALIGASALAVHGYPRATRDMDLGVATDPFSTLSEAQLLLRASFGEGVQLVTPDADDPLGGVLTIRGGDFDPDVRVVDIPHLVALKLYSGGYKSRLDLLELLERSPETSLDAIRDVCARFELLADWERILKERSS